MVEQIYLSLQSFYIYGNRADPTTFDVDAAFDNTRHDMEQAGFDDPTPTTVYNWVSQMVRAMATAPETKAELMKLVKKRYEKDQTKYAKEIKQKNKQKRDSDR